jgi:hypothetical protein
MAMSHHGDGRVELLASRMGNLDLMAEKLVHAFCTASVSLALTAFCILIGTVCSLWMTLSDMSRWRDQDSVGVPMIARSAFIQSIVTGDSRNL